MRSLPAALAALFAVAGTLLASDLPTVSTPLPALTVAQGETLSAIDLRNYFEVTGIAGQVVQFRTSQGTYNVEMLPAAAPASVTNFLSYVNGNRYANTFIHRSDKGLGVIQGGGYAVTVADPLEVGRIATDPPIALEYNLPNARGTIAMARTSALNSATSEWFINTKDNTTTLGAANNGGYAVFGRVTGTGMTVVDAIHALPVFNAGGAYTQLPLRDFAGGNVAVANFVMMNANEAVPLFPASAGQNAVVSFSVTNTNPALVTASLSGSTLNLTLSPSQSGIANLTVTATDTNGNAVQISFRITVGTTISGFGPPALSDFRKLAARATLLVGRKKVAGIYVEDGTGAASVPAFQGGPVPGVAGSTFKKLLDPIIAPDGAITFGGTVQGGGVKANEDFGVWTEAFGAELALALREGSDVPGLPPGTRLKSVTSLSARNGELLALLKLAPAAGLVSAADDTVLLRLTGTNTATVLLREGRELSGIAASKIKSFSVLSSALGSPGHGRWHGDGLVVAKVALADGGTLIVKIAADGAVTPLLSTTISASMVDPAARWKTFGLPAADSTGSCFAVAATLQPKLGGVVAGNDGALLISTDGAAWNVLAREGDAAPLTPAGPRYASFFDPLVNDADQVAFLATLQGTGVKGTNKTALFSGPANDVQLVARLGDPAPDETGTPTAALWSKFISIALPSGAGAGAIFLAETKGGDSTTKNKLALWAVDSQGNVRRLLRTGTSLEASAPIAKLTLLNAVPGAYGTTRSFNATGSIALLATFTDKSQSLVRLDIP